MAIYETLGRYYDALVKDDQAADQWVDWIESFHPGKTVLEPACGSGEITERLAKQHDVTALDLSQNMIDAAKAKPGSENITFYRAICAICPACPGLI
ncbi:bifunctional 2-polyprenyl-6-hydroxyphenol methylase/3-demethylubiquinol 3-O-methyltransferase UbiG [Allobaculum sp. Allo2]|uniref:class I SAM-dependent methyltransferase n=1 Tax=Allobaculum sp. Allo2 TaxID=2853432 RepID=UPI001F6037D2|nr:class I SAM-dependent methyltransferase [Allobaculum sp. Allo2]UNT93393.1 class I SAM-dependent methyltransferase [Allobaculum sp. Allo2]